MNSTIKKNCRNLKLHLFTHKTFQQKSMLSILQALVIYLRKYDQTLSKLLMVFFFHDMSLFTQLWEDELRQ